MQPAVLPAQTAVRRRDRSSGSGLIALGSGFIGPRLGLLDNTFRLRPGLINNIPRIFLRFEQGGGVFLVAFNLAAVGAAVDPQSARFPIRPGYSRPEGRGADG